MRIKMENKSSNDIKILLCGVSKSAKNKKIHKKISKEDNFKEINSAKNDIFKKTEESKDEISLIYFVLTEINLEYFIERISKKSKEIPIILINNRNPEKSAKTALITFLKNNNCDSLYEKYPCENTNNNN